MPGTSPHDLLAADANDTSSGQHAKRAKPRLLR
jgi:hypothetical protein